MKRRVYFIGNIFTQNQPFKAYVLRALQVDGTDFSIEYFSEADRDFFEELERRVSHKEQIFLVSSKKSVTLISKLLCSITDDKLVLKDEQLIPSKCEHFSQGSYLLHVKKSVVNLLEVQESTALPKVYLQNITKIQRLHYFEHSVKEVIDATQTLSRQFDVTLNYSQRIEGWVEVEVRCNTFGSIEKFIEILQQGHPENIIVTEDLVQHIINILEQRREKISFSESCTGGLLAYYFTSHAGVSSVFEGSLVTYSNILKENWLAVENKTLVDNGAVSEAVVSEMCDGALTVANADYALGISGIAGPDGGSEEKPVGTVVIGFKSATNEKVITHHFQGDRKYIQEQSAHTALKMLILGAKKVFFTN